MSEKILYGFGDSLVDGHCLGIGMLDALAEKYGLDYHKFARNGAAVLPSARADVLDIATQIESAPATPPDMVCFDGLTNDTYTPVMDHLGQLSDTYCGHYDQSTFYGAFERICFLLRNKYPDSAIFYICVHKMPTRDMAVQAVLQMTAREVCEKWSIPYADVFRQGEINTCVDAMRVKYSYDTAESLTGGNGTHLNAAGYLRWYLPLLEKLCGPYIR